MQILAGNGIHLESSLVVPLANGIYAEVLIVVGRCWSIKDHGADSAVSVLRAVVSMVPGCTELRHVIGVGASLSRCERALAQSVDTVGARRVILSDTVPVN